MWTQQNPAKHESNSLELRSWAEEKAVFEIVRKRYNLPSDIQIKKVDENIFSVSRNTVGSFVDRNGETLINLNQIRWLKNWKLPTEGFKTLIDTSFAQAGYLETHDMEKKQFKLYDVKWKERKEIAPDSKEYFKAWKELEFFYWRMSLSVRLKNPPENEEERIATVKWLEEQTRNGYIRIRDLILLSSKNLGYLKQEDFQKLLPIAIQALPAQIEDADGRWWRAADPITLKQGYSITIEELNSYSRFIPEDRLDAYKKKLEEKNRKKSEIRNETHIKTSMLESEVGNAW